jgi:hypothetical protein
MAQWKRAGPITQRSLDRNEVLLLHVFVFVNGNFLEKSLDQKRKKLLIPFLEKGRPKREKKENKKIRK